ncbi:MAG: class I SAM-dependent methyltransferase family protein [Candidatus Omnitrophica bacterium]|nr:class I SAM-dependent methyltransferase family protein [Candidatus Omnitrophota bacterium]
MHHRRLSEKKHWRPNVVVASGFYEYIDDNLSLSTLEMIKESLDKNGLLLLITQQGSPNRKLIEKIGMTQSGKKWILFYRKPETITGWLNNLGYRDIDVEIDPWKMYVFYKARCN